MSKNIKVPDFLAIAEQLKKDTRIFAKTHFTNWFQESFYKQGFTNASFEAWEKRKNDKDPGRAILIDTTFLRNSIGVLQEEDTSITFGTNVPYASLHNNGERLRATQNVRSHHRTRNGKREQVKAHTRRIDTQYPKRQFMGESQQAMKIFNDWVISELEKRFNTL